MTGKRPWVGWMICWKYLSPLALFIVLVATFVDLSKAGAGYGVFVGCSQVCAMHILVYSRFLVIFVTFPDTTANCALCFHDIEIILPSYL